MLSHCFLFFFLIHLSVGLILTRVKLYAFDNSWHFRKQEKKKKKIISKVPVCETSDFPPRSFPVFNGATALLVWQEVRNGHFLLALHWLQINVLLMFLPLLEFLLYFLWLCCSLYIHLLEKGYFFWKTYYSGFLVANFAFSVLFFFVTLFTILPKLISFFRFS